MLTHSTTRVQYKCTHCDHAPFLVATGLRKHIARVHPEHVVAPPRSVAPSELEFPCDQCDRRYSKRQSLRRHKRDIHNDRIRPQKETNVSDSKVGTNGIKTSNLTSNSNVKLTSFTSNGLKSGNFALNSNFNIKNVSTDDLAPVDQIQNTFSQFTSVQILDEGISDNVVHNSLVRTLSADSMNAVFMTDLDGA